LHYQAYVAANPSSGGCFDQVGLYGELHATPAQADALDYAEGLLVGYRGYDASGTAPRLRPPQVCSASLTMAPCSTAPDATRVMPSSRYCEAI